MVSCAPACSGWPIGTYAVHTEQADCVSSSLPQVVTVSCGAQTTFTALSIQSVSKLQAENIEIVVTGQNLDKLALFGNSIRLYQPQPLMPGGSQCPDPGNDPDLQALLHPDMAEANRTIDGTISDSTNPSAIKVAFNFHNKALGAYRLEGTRADTCGDPTPLENALTIVAPPETQRMPNLKNGGFELGQTEDWAFSGDNLIHQNNFNGFDATAQEGIWMAARWINGEDMIDTFEQDLGLPSGPGPYNLVLTYWVQMKGTAAEDCGTVPRGSSLTASIIADEGLPTESISSTTVESDPQWRWAPSWLNANVDFSSSEVTTGIKVRFVLSTIHDPTAGWGKSAIDDVRVYSAGTVCAGLFADADKDGDVD
jgi:hypothetical protein